MFSNEQVVNGDQCEVVSIGQLGQTLVKFDMAGGKQIPGGQCAVGR